MRLLASLRSLVANLFHRQQVDDEIEEELRSHIEHRADDLERSGLSREEAVRHSRIEFGFIVVSIVLALVAVFAGLLPARRAASIDPMQALRVE